MRSLLIAAFFASGFAEKLSAQSGVAAISEQLNLVQFSGNTRGAGEAQGIKAGVSALLQSVSESGKLDDVAKATLVTVSGLLNGILVQLGLDRDTEQPNINAILTSAPACVVQSVVDATSTKDTVQQGAATTHEDCRTAEAANYDTHQTECNEVISALGGLGLPDCSSLDDKTKTNGDAWVTHLTEIKTWFDTASTALNAVKADCAAATTALNDKTTECNADQQTYESSLCAYFNAQNQMCTTQAACYAAAVAAHAAITGVVFPESAQRVNDAQMVTYVKCLVDELSTVDGHTMDTLSAACDATKAADYSSYANTDVTVPDMAICNFATFSPDNQDFDAVAYAGIDQVKSQTQDLNVNC